jgi:hypothetical protein
MELRELGHDALTSLTPWVIWNTTRGCVTPEPRYAQDMSKRLQVRIPDPEVSDIQRFVERERLTIGEWVRRTLRKACVSQP